MHGGDGFSSKPSGKSLFLCQPLCRAMVRLASSDKWKALLDSGFHVLACVQTPSSLGLPRHGFTISGTGFLIHVSGIWIPDSNRKWDSGLLELYSGFQTPGFWIPEANISQIPDSASKYFPDSGIRIPLQLTSNHR